MARNVATVTLLTLLVGGALSAAPTSCEALAKLALPTTTIKTAESVPAGSFKPPQGPAIPDLPAFCRVAGVIKPSDDSDIEFEVWMPSAGWNGKFQGIGNGGFAGSIGFGALAAALAHGYASASTDTGHQGGATDATWALNHPQKITDFGYRAVHETTEKAKAIVHAFYGDAPKRSYFSSCSNGGREALMEAQRYPADYDGIVAGAPAGFWTHLIMAGMWDMNATVGDPASYIPAAKMATVEAAAVASCDMLDGVKDGVIDDPTRCHFTPSTLLCKGPDMNTCLTQPQVTALEKIYSGVKNSKGEQVFPGFSAGGEGGMNGWGGWVAGGAPGKSLQDAFAVNFFQNMLYSDAAWDFHKFDVDHDTKLADDSLGQTLNATDPDLKRFKDRGGKLIIYHGWSDAAIPPTATIEYYNRVAAKMGASNAESFVRLFMVPGMQHCAGGPGATEFGQTVVKGADPQHDVNAALERWVEQGTAPEQIVATKYKGASPASGVERTRPLCRYPLVAHWNGTGSSDDAANFTCVAATANHASK
jgi:hypothetical protein